MDGRLTAWGLVLWGAGWGCAGSPGPAADAPRAAVEVRAEGVEVRQYRRGELRLEVRADRLRLLERDGRLELEGGVRGLAAPKLAEDLGRGGGT